MVAIALSILLLSQERSAYVPPDKLQLFSFLKSLPSPRVKTYGPTVSYKGGKGWESYPGWQYIIDKSAIDVAHLLKQALTKRAGWDLKFPDTHYCWRCNAVHTKNGGQDWHLMLHGFQHGGAVLDMWDESTVISRRQPKGWPKDSLAPGGTVSDGIRAAR